MTGASGSYTWELRVQVDCQNQVDRIIYIPNEQGISEFGRERGRNIWIRPNEHIFVKNFAARCAPRRTASATAAMSAARERDREVAREAHLERQQ